MVLLDSSAILAYLWGERGCDQVEAGLAAGATCTVVNWCEVATKVMASGGDWAAAEAALQPHRLRVVPIEVEDALVGARLWAAHKTLSLGDRLCIAVGLRLGASIVTADQAWGAVSNRVRVINRRSAP